MKRNIINSTPDVRAAGHSPIVSDSISACLQRPVTPDGVQLSATARGKAAVGMRQTNEMSPMLERRVFGVKTSNIQGHTLLNPPPGTVGYSKGKKIDSEVDTSLGRSCPTQELPASVTPDTHFGIKTVRVGGMKECLVDDAATAHLGESQELLAMRQSLRINAEPQPGEQTIRNYDNTSVYNQDQCFGKPTPSHKDGRSARSAMNWAGDGEQQSLSSTNRLDYSTDTLDPQQWSARTNKIQPGMDAETTFGDRSRKSERAGAVINSWNPPQESEGSESKNAEVRAMTHGVTSVQLEGRFPTHRKLTNTKNYGDETVGQLLSSSPFASRSINEAEFHRNPMGQTEIARLCAAAGYDVSRDEFAAAWAKCCQPDGETAIFADVCNWLRQ